MSWYSFWLQSGDKRCLLSRKVWWVVRIGSFCPKLRYFTDQNGPKGGPHQNEFRLFSNTKMNVTNNWSGKITWTTLGVLSSFHVSFQSYGLKIAKKRAFFYNFVLTSARNLSLLKQFTYMYLKVLITIFQKMLWYIGVWATIHEILAIKI